MPDRPPPYFPQQIGAPDEDRYKKFKRSMLIIGLVVFGLLLVAIASAIYLVKYLSAGS